MLKKLGLSTAIALFAVMSTFNTAQAAPAKQDKVAKVQPVKQAKQMTSVRAPRQGGSLRAAGFSTAGVVGLASAGIFTIAVVHDMNKDDDCVSGC